MTFELDDSRRSRAVESAECEHFAELIQQAQKENPSLHLRVRIGGEGEGIVSQQLKTDDLAVLDFKY